MNRPDFPHTLYIDAIWRQTRDNTAFRSAIERTLPASLCAQAQARITRWEQYRATPLLGLPAMAAAAGLAAIHCKDEGPRFGLGSFKALGGAYAVALATAQQPGRMTVTCATEGNHGRSVAWGAQRAGVDCVIFLHAGVSPAREAAIAQYGARIIRVPGDYDDAVRACAQVAAQNGWQIISDTTWEGYEDIPKWVMAGYSVLAQELQAQLPQAPTHVFLQGGVGGMAAALMASLERCWPDAGMRYILVEPRSAACLMASARAGGEYRNTPGPFDTISAGLACGEPSRAVLEIICQGSDMMLALDDAAIKHAVRRFARPSQGDPAIVSGASGAAGLAGLQTVLATPILQQALALDQHSRVLLINTENDTDPQAYRDILQEG
ncbi:diaminopropionate ammonia-lyase [Kerstersia gyiorum]|uniref:diaminopropionate ammonia-lyase n=1 Tax=Kerstersia gyiorum TaxID=206506 RepID=UPI0021504600|nr:diaminopropionate ammonia-lyase [Kerstersia gyiorum]MCR4158024.1 diaminopropionate ammonia-lyase [Kerstersia gyiorum]